jgi:glycerophosphoryl diester phosphodiesterase
MQTGRPPRALALDVLLCDRIMELPSNRFLAALRSTRSHPLIVAHRGDSFHAPENTLEAARSAWECGAAAWELDVQLTRDGIPIVIHDESLARTTDVATRFAQDPRGQRGFRVAEFDLAEIRSLDAGTWFVHRRGGPRTSRAFGTFLGLDASSVAAYRSGSVRVPTLEEALFFTRDHDWLVNIEIKSFPQRPPGFLDRVLETIAATETADRVLISSFDHGDVAAANRPGRRYALGILADAPLYRIQDYAVDLVGAETVHLSTQVIGAETISYRRARLASVLRTGIVGSLKARGIPTLVYTVNDPPAGDLAAHLAEIGVDGLFSDSPEGLARRFAAFDRGRAH